MNFIASSNNNRFRSDSYSYSSVIEDGFLDTRTISLSPSSCFHLPVSSFEDPFDDPNMEPSPLRPKEPDTHTAPQTQSLYDSSFMMMDDSTIFSSDLETENFNDPTGKVGAKRSFGDFSSQNDEGSYCSIVASSKRSRGGFFLSSNHNHQGDPCNKRQRTTSHVQSTFGDEESTARFRPYQEKQWRDQFQKLIQYKMRNGHCCVPHSYQEDPVLARWVKRQRYQYKKFNDNNPTSTMTTRRIQDLESIGFIWQSHASAWQEKFNELKAFKQRTGHCNVPSDYPENVGLSTWAKCQRRQYKLYKSGASSSMTIHRLQTLESLGFVFEPQLFSKRRD